MYCTELSLASMLFGRLHGVLYDRTYTELLLRGASHFIVHSNILQVRCTSISPECVNQACVVYNYIRYSYMSLEALGIERPDILIPTLPSFYGGHAE